MEAMQRGATKSATTEIYQLKITLNGIRPPIWRRVQVPGNMLLPDLSIVIQTVMGWHGMHLHAFRVGDTSYGERSPELDNWMKDERRVRLAQIAPVEKCKFRYEYDFGDDWEHTILVEKILAITPEQVYPICLKGKRACPPEDCGGTWGYIDLLEAISDPEHEEHEEMLTWHGKFDPEAFDLAGINLALRARF